MVPDNAKSSAKGIFNAIISSSSFGFAPYFSILLLGAGLSGAEVLTYRWGTAAVSLALVAAAGNKSLRCSGKEFFLMFILSLFRALTSAALIIAYSNMSSGAASTIHFMYPIVVAVCMMIFFGERWSPVILTAIAISIAGAMLLVSGDGTAAHGDNTTKGIIWAVVSVFSYAGYFILVRKTDAVNIESTKLACYVMGLGAIYFMAGGFMSGGIRLVSEPRLWLWIICLGVIATMVSNYALVNAIKQVGPTLTSVFGAMEPLTAVIMGVIFLGEELNAGSIAGIIMIVAAVITVIVSRRQ